MYLFRVVRTQLNIAKYKLVQIVRMLCNMDFLFAIPNFIFYLISSLFSWVFSVISGIVGIVLWPVKLLWGLLMGLGKTLISIVLLPTLLFSHPADISATQPIVSTSATVSNTYNLEQIFNDIQELELAGIKMQPLRNNKNLRECGIQMREYQDQVKDLIERTNALPIQYKITLGAAASRLNSCVSCTTSAQDSCKLVRMELNDYESMIE